MGHRCCSKQKVKRGLWSPEEDDKLVNHITTHGHGSWSSVPKLAGLQRCGKSCRLRWINYLRPDLKKGSFTEEEEQIIIDVHRILGNRWAQIAKHLPGRTDNEVKNFWNSCIKKKLMSQGLDPQTHNLLSSHQTRSSSNNSNVGTNNKNNNNIKNGVTSFVVSHDSHEQEPISVFSMSSSSSKDFTNVISSHHHQYDQMPNRNSMIISTVDHHHYQQHNPCSSSGTTKAQIDNKANYNFNNQQYYNNNNNYNMTSSSSPSQVDNVIDPSRSCTFPDHDFGIWGSTFEPSSFEVPRLMEPNGDHQYSMEGHHHHHDHHDNGHEKDGQIIQDNDIEKSTTFDLGFMESALMSDVMCTNDFSSMEYDISWNY